MTTSGVGVNEGHFTLIVAASNTNSHEEKKCGQHWFSTHTKKFTRKILWVTLMCVTFICSNFESRWFFNLLVFWYFTCRVSIESLKEDQMLYLSIFRQFFKISTCWLLQFYHKIPQYTCDIPKVYGRCVNPYWLLECCVVKIWWRKQISIFMLNVYNQMLNTEINRNNCCIFL